MPIADGGFDYSLRWDRDQSIQASVPSDSRRIHARFNRKLSCDHPSLNEVYKARK